MNTSKSKGLINALAQEVNGERVALGLTIQQLADKAELSKSTIDRLNKGTLDVKLTVLAALAEVLQMEPLALLQKAQDRQKKNQGIS